MKSLAVLSLAAALAAHAQAPAFEVASIKPNRSMAARNSIHLSKGLVQMENVSLKKVMLNAWGIPDDREYMVDGPGWLATEHFDIEARFPADAPLPQVRQMMSWPCGVSAKAANRVPALGCGALRGTAT